MSDRFINSDRVVCIRRDTPDANLALVADSRPDGGAASAKTGQDTPDKLTAKQNLSQAERILANVRKQLNNDLISSGEKTLWYDDGSDRTVIVDKSGKVSQVFNPNGSKWERVNGSDKDFPQWKVFDANGIAQAKGFTAQIVLDSSGLFVVEQTAPVQRTLIQQPNGSYTEAAADGTIRHWNAKTLELDTFQTNGDTVRDRYVIDRDTGVLRKLNSAVHKLPLLAK